MQKFESTFNSSKSFIIIQILFLIGSLVGVGYLPFPFIVRVFIGVMAIGYCAYIFKKRTEWIGLRHDTNGWWLQNKDDEINVEITGDTTVTRFVSVLRFRAPYQRAKGSCVIFYDAMRPDLYRQLIVRLRYYK